MSTNFALGTVHQQIRKDLISKGNNLAMTGNQFNVLGTNNPVLDEITRAHTQLSDPAKVALRQAGLGQPATPAPEAPPFSMAAPSAPAPKMAMPTAQAPAVPANPPRFLGPVGPVQGMSQMGNIDLANRPNVQNPDGTHSSVRTITAGFGDKTYLLPTVVNGKIVSNDEAIQHYKDTGEQMGGFDNEDAAENYDKNLHRAEGMNAAPGSPQDKWMNGAKPAAQPTPAPPTPLQAEYERKATTGSGISQIHNPWARVPLQIAEGIGNAFAPAITQSIPGTELHHNMLLSHDKAAVDTEDALKNTQARRGLEGAQTQNYESENPLHEAQANEANARADSLKNPPAKIPTNAFELWMRQNPGKDAGEWLKTEEGAKTKDQVNSLIGLWLKDNPNGTASDLQKFLDQGKAAPEGEQKLTPEQVKQLNRTSQARYRVLHPSQALPDEFTLDQGATQKDYDRVERALGGVENAETAAANRTANQKQGQEKQGAAERREYLKEYQPALDSAERFNVMTKNYEDAIKNHDQQAMLSLLANHLGMTMGLQKGARLTKDIIREAEQSRPWLQGLAAKFDGNGYLTGVNLTPEQMRQMVSLGRERFAEDARKSASGARYLGSTDDGPERAPNVSTIHHYLDLAGGDLNKAKQLAAHDGWSVK